MFRFDSNKVQTKIILNLCAHGVELMTCLNWCYIRLMKSHVTIDTIRRCHTIVSHSMFVIVIETLDSREQVREVKRKKWYFNEMSSRQLIMDKLIVTKTVHTSRAIRFACGWYSYSNLVNRCKHGSVPHDCMQKPNEIYAIFSLFYNR